MENVQKGKEKSSKGTSKNSRISGLAEEEDSAAASKCRFLGARRRPDSSPKSFRQKHSFLQHKCC